MALDRRGFLKSTAAGLTALGAYAFHPRPGLADYASLSPEALPEGVRQTAELHALDGKLPLIKRTWRPPNYETPVAYFDELYTPDEAFFVRYHLSAIPEVTADKWTLSLSGDVAKPLQFNLEELKREFPQTEMTALCLCAGNQRGLLLPPHAPGVQWGHGAMGNARWKGVRLRDVLLRAGLSAKTVEVAFGGADSGVLDKTADFVKSLPTNKAMDENTLIAFEMNGKPLPHWNGFPARLVVPGWAASYWLKHLTSITALTQPQDSYWMQKSYRMPKGLFPHADAFPTHETEDSVTLTTLPVNSLILHPLAGETVKRSERINLNGLAWDGGHGIARVDISLDQGRSWLEAKLGENMGRYAWRPWSFSFQAQTVGDQPVLARATNALGDTQPMEAIQNPSGYYQNAVQQLLLRVI